MFWEAQSRGLKSLLVEKQDYCSRTSANSLKTIHGGIRYLQTLNLSRTWRSSKEPETLIRIAPHLVHPLTCILPTQRKLKRSRLAVTAGFGFYNLIKRFSSPAQRLPAARCLTKSELVSMTALLDMDNVTGAGLWFDAQVQHAERLGLAFVKSAQAAGGDAYNYLKATRVNEAEDRCLKVTLSDQIDQNVLQVTAQHVVLNTASDTALNLNRSSGICTGQSDLPAFCLGLNLVTGKKYADYAIGLQSGFASHDQAGARRLLFSAPWRNSTMFGTWYFQHNPEQDDNLTPTAEQIGYCLSDINRSYPGLALCPEDIVSVHSGLLPVQGKQSEPEHDLMEHDLIQQPDESLNLFTVIPTKYTTCRATSEQVIDLLSHNTGTPVRRSISAETPLAGGNIGTEFSEFLMVSRQRFKHLLPLNVIDQLCVCYGDEMDKIAAICEADQRYRELIPGSNDHIKAQLLYELKTSMVFKPADYIWRRSFLGADQQLNRQSAVFCCEEINRFHSRHPDIDRQVSELLSSAH